MSMIFRVVLEGGVPWGFRVDNDSRLHVPKISKLRVSSKAERAGLQQGDVILSVNGRSTAGLREVDVIDFMQQSQRIVCLEIERSVPRADVRQAVDDDDIPSCSSYVRSESLFHELQEHCGTDGSAVLSQRNITPVEERGASAVVHSYEDDVIKSSASETFDLNSTDQQQTVIDLCQTNATTTSRPTLMFQAEPNEHCSSTETSSVCSEGRSASSLENNNGPETTVYSNIQEQNGVKDTAEVQVRTDPLLKHLLQNASESLLANNSVFLTEKHSFRLKTFQGIGPTDEETGIPIASKSMVEESCQKEWYRQMFLAVKNLTGLKCPPMFVFAGEDPDPRLRAACRFISLSDDEFPINTALKKKVERQNSVTESIVPVHHHHLLLQSCSRSSSSSRSPITPQSAFINNHDRFGQLNDALYETPRSLEHAMQDESSPVTTCHYATPPDARQASTTSSGHNGDLFSQYSATWMLYGDDGFVNNNGSNTADSVNCTTDHDDSRATAINAPHPRVTEFTRDNQTHSVQRLCVQYNYSPRHADELELNKGDIINLVDVCDDGWFLGTSQRTGQFGTFPGNYARPVQ